MTGPLSTNHYSSVQFYERVHLEESDSLSGRLQELKTKEKCSWVIPKVVAVAYGSGHLRELFVKKFE